MFKGCDGRVCDAWSVLSPNLFAAKHRLPPGLHSEMTSERRVSRIRSGRRPAQTASRIIPWLRGLAAMRAPKLPHTVFKQHLTSVLLPLCCKRRSSVDAE